MKLLPLLAALGLSLAPSFAQAAEEAPAASIQASPRPEAVPSAPSGSPLPPLESVPAPKPDSLPVPLPEIAVAPLPAPRLAKFEPERGCYIGAFIDRDYTVQGDIGAWTELTKKKHASFYTYVGYGRPFPTEWVEKLKRNGAAPHIAFEPNDGLDIVQDGPYLRAWARDAARSGVPIFLRWASEMNGPWTAYGKSPAQYVEKFRLMSRVMKEEAPNVAMVWTPFAEPQRTIASYYPGDEWVDWVGINIYAVFVNNGDPFRRAAQKDIVGWLRWIHDRYAGRKPIHVSEFAATIFCEGTSEDTVGFAIDRMRKFYGAIKTQFPRVKSVNWFCWDTIRAKRAKNNYSLIDDGRALAEYRRIIADPHFLASVAPDASLIKASVPEGTTLGPNGIFFKAASGADELLAVKAALASQGGVLGGGSFAPSSTSGAPANTRPELRGVAAGEVVRGVLELSLVLPPGVEARRITSVSWLVDGRAAWLTNSPPFSWSLRARRLAPGTHTAQVQVWLQGSDAPLSSNEVPFEVAD